MNRSLFTSDSPISCFGKTARYMHFLKYALVPYLHLNAALCNMRTCKRICKCTNVACNGANVACERGSRTCEPVLRTCECYLQTCVQDLRTRSANATCERANVVCERCQRILIFVPNSHSNTCNVQMLVSNKESGVSRSGMIQNAIKFRMIRFI